MTRARRTSLVALAALLPALSACVVELPLYHDEAGPDLAEPYAMCLAPESPAHSPQLTDCVVARYVESRREEERLRAGLQPPAPPAGPALVPSSAALREPGGDH